MPTNRWPSLAWLGLALAACLSACSNPPSKASVAGDGDAPGSNENYASCKRSDQCESGYCLEVGDDRRVCTKGCDERRDCPSGENWVCGTTRELDDSLCLCLADGPERCGDGIDNDCNGKTDDCLLCDGRQFPPNNREHCGECGNTCKVGTSCKAGQCLCEDGSPPNSCTSADTPECENDGHCYDRNDCTRDRCVAGSCQHTLAFNPCEAGESCDLVTGRCELGSACFKDADCGDRNACTANERCDPALRVCVWTTLDGDHDGEAPLICGGTDCDDSNGIAGRTRLEMCDGIDNDCDNTIDGFLASVDCGEGHQCSDGTCECLPGLVECTAGACSDLDTDPQHCGTCGHGCPAGASCDAGNCVCPAGGELCDGACQLPDWFASNALHCGDCAHACSGGQTCQAGACACPGGLTMCNGVCTNTSTDIHHCGGCGEPCDASAVGCAGGVCQCPHQSDLLCGDKCVSSDHPLSCGACDTACAICGVDQCIGASKLFVGFGGSCALMSNGELYCWGGFSTVHPRPTRIDLPNGSALSNVVDVVFGWAHACARTSGNEAYCWGFNDYGELGNGSTTSAESAQHVEISAGKALSNVAELAAGDDVTCARLSSGEAYCWGYYWPGNGSNTPQSRPVRVETDANVALAGINRVFMGPRNGCAVLQSGQLYCWGENSYGTVGDGSTTTRMRPVRVETDVGVPLAGVAEVAVGSLHACARLNTNEVYCWGNNVNGELGNGSTSQANRPVRVETIAGTALANVAAIAVGDSTSCARLANGEIYCWGDNTYGIAGANPGPTVSRPQRLGANLNRPFLAASKPGFASSGTGLESACALPSGANPTLACWGYGASGLLGIGQVTFSPQPTYINGPLVSVSSFGLGYGYACALLSNGLVYCWGGNLSGELGTGSSATNASTPQLVLWP
ncbi:MAG: MopE-related protein [Myxococcales bacterium]